MADNDIKPAGKKKPHPAIFVGVIVLILIVLGFAQYVSKVSHDIKASQETTATDQAAATDETAAQNPATTATEANVKIDVNAALSDRGLGDPSAPVKISEHASLTCSHCGDFHRETFDKIKKEYIDTGKVYLIFSDFPLNAPAIQASMVARCLSEDKYFDFIHMLYERQQEWAYDANYIDFLKERAAENGLDEAHFQACVTNTDLQNGIVNRMKGVQQQWNINSTPSFVINNRTTISGAYPYEEFKKIIDTELSGKRADVPGATDKSETAPDASGGAAKAAAETPAESPAATTTPAAGDDSTSEDTPAPDEAPAATPDNATAPAATTGSEGSGATQPE